ncbi:DNA-directed DNA polymerase [Halobacterium salinarum]|uniref:DNA-directed DNA polymerase n=1 Tax=Halobacterium salinarum TaxID=2242 RepID=UPI002557A589|nr:DNA-directed DNA polymerase [Halobacterium salinarum]MDL0120600.1 DNA-directed DNA polymerase [Halobacterium salinarum]
MGNTELSEFMHESDGADDPGEDAIQEEAAVVAGDADPVVNEVLTAEADALPDATGEVELMVTQVDYTIEGSGDRERPVLHVFGRTTDDEAEHVRVHGFRPYFYAPTATLSEDDLTDDVITGTEDGYESIRGEALTKIFGRTPRDVGNIRDAFDHYEADILFPNRLLIDKDITDGVRVPARRADDGALYVHHDEIAACETAATLRVNTFDIEVNDRNGFPEDGEEPVVCLTSHDSYRDEYVAWLYAAPDATVDAPTAVPGYDPLTDDADIDVRVFDTEEAMHDAFLSYIEDTNPDVLTGWNFDDFDAPYLIDRLDELDPRTDHDLDSDRLSRVSEVWTSGWGGPNVKGRVVFDLLYAYQRTKYSELDSYRLDAVGEQELGVGKERYPGDIGDLWEDDPERLLEYNLRDVELCVEIDRKQSIVAFWDEARKLVGCKLEDATTPGDAVDMYVLHKAFGNFVLPSKGQQDAEEFEGGAVFDPITGVRENVSVLDLKSLYPMSMVTINASPETKVDPEEFDGDTYRTPTGVHFRKEPDGIIREMVDELLTEREEKKARRDDHEPDSEDYERYDRQQAAVKVIMNSLYGVFGWDRFRLYDRAMSAGVTSTNREVIDFTEQAAEEFGYEVAYGDTDSVMLELGDDMTKAEAIAESFDIEDHINAAYDEFAREQLHADDHRFQIEFEKLYRRFFQAGKKKRYAGHIVWKEGKDVDDVDITGFEYQRSDIAPITKRVQKEVIDLVVREGDVDAVEEYVHGVIEEFQEGDADLDDIGIPGGIGKRLDNYETDTAQVRGAKYANLLLGTNFDRGSKPKRLYLAKVHPDFWGHVEDEQGIDTSTSDRYREFRRDPDVICYEYADQIPDTFVVDYDKMLDKTLKGPIERILEALDLSWDEVKSGQTQTGLGQFT